LRPSRNNHFTVAVTHRQGNGKNDEFPFNPPPIAPKPYAAVDSGIPGGLGESRGRDLGFSRLLNSISDVVHGGIDAIGLQEEQLSGLSDFQGRIHRSFPAMESIDLFSSAPLQDPMAE
jgi:hypothetical protein